PFLEPRFVSLLFDRLGDHDVAVAETDGFVHPLAAVYRRTVLETAERLVVDRRLRPIFLYERVPTVRIAADELRRADPELRTLANLNTPEEYERALAEISS
ncbi:MAG: molybdenum cofactor guanylyltransferase, partial [Planctomycetota bacterium]